MDAKKKQLSFIKKISPCLAVIPISLAIFSAGAAAKTTPTIVYNAHGKTVPIYAAPSGNIKPSATAPNNSRFVMNCWVDSSSYTGNYKSKRWFFGEAYANGHWGFVPASYVYYQTTVPHC